MTAIIVLTLAFAAFRAAQYLLVLAVDGVATATAGWYCWRSARLTPGLLAVRASCNANDFMSAWSVSRAHRRLMARHLRLSIAMTAHFSLFPRSSVRGYAIANALDRHRIEG